MFPPADVNFSETLNTLKYANRAKNIKNKVTINMNIKNTEIVKLKEKIQELQLELLKSRQIRRALGAGINSDMGNGQILQDLAVLQQNHDRLQRENQKLQCELQATEQSL